MATLLLTSSSFERYINLSASEDGSTDFRILVACNVFIVGHCETSGPDSHRYGLVQYVRTTEALLGSKLIPSMDSIYGINCLQLYLYYVRYCDHDSKALRAYVRSCLWSPSIEAKAAVTSRLPYSCGLSMALSLIGLNSLCS